MADENHRVPMDRTELKGWWVVSLYPEQNCSLGMVELSRINL